MDHQTPNNNKNNVDDKNQQKQVKQLFSLSDLASLLLRRILFFLGPQALCRLATTCRKLNSEASDDVIWRNLSSFGVYSLPFSVEEKEFQRINGLKGFYRYMIEDKKSTWEFSQMFGEDDPEDDIEEDVNWISALSFDATGSYLAVGYNCGQVVVLKQQDEDNTYQLYTEFKSHESEFDFLTSMEIEEKINLIRWYPFSGNAEFLMTCNDKTIKLFKMYEKVSSQKADVQVTNKQVYEGAHAYNINSISFNSDGETFISSDDLRINLWNLHINNEAFGLVDIKPENIDDLTEVITSASFHPNSCNILAYSTSKGVIRMGDLRDHALCDVYSKVFAEPDNDIGGFFQELVTTISDLKFSRDGRFIVSRDYLTMKVWDIRTEAKPIKTVKFHDHLISKLCDLYENDSIFDKFECCWNHNSLQLLTGSYNNNFYICDVVGEKPDMKSFRCTRPNHEPTNARLDASQKVLHVDWHPRANLVALGAKDFGYLYQKRPLTQRESE